MSVHQIQTTSASLTKDSAACTAELPVTELEQDIKSHIDFLVQKQGIYSLPFEQEERLWYPRGITSASGGMQRS